MRRLLPLAAGAALLAACAGDGFDPKPAPEPAKPVELSRYLGRWYEIARYPNRFEDGCEAVTADYARRPDGLISVLNTCRKGSPTGPVEQARGRAKVVGGAGAKLKVSFFGPFFGDYWVLDRAEDYSWALVGDSRGGLFWILSRSPDPPNRAELVQRAAALGYDPQRLIFPRHASETAR
jgi:apolipoprotein D and lipocalin family protein